MKFALILVGLVCLSLALRVEAGSYEIAAGGNGRFVGGNGHLEVQSTLYEGTTSSGGARSGLITEDTNGFLQLDVSLLIALGVTLQSVSIQNPDNGLTYHFYGTHTAGDIGTELPGSPSTSISGIGDDWPKDENGDYYTYLSITCNGDIKIVIVVIIVICEPCDVTTTEAPRPPLPPGGQGDPQFFGLQHQNFQFHGMADEVFSLVSSPDIRVNSLFKYISSGTCNYNDTVCWTHPGTYLDQIGISYGSNDKILLKSGSHSNGMKIYINDKELRPSNKPHNLRTYNSTAMVKFESSSTFILDSDLIYMRIVNSDYFFNFDFGLKDQSILSAGAQPLQITGEICELESRAHLNNNNNYELVKQKSQIKKLLANTYPNYPLHGLIGQTWRNVFYCGRYFEGTVDDYVTGDLFTNPFTFNYFNY